MNRTEGKKSEKGNISKSKTQKYLMRNNLKTKDTKTTRTTTTGKSAAKAIKIGDEKIIIFFCCCCWFSFLLHFNEERLSDDVQSIAFKVNIVFKTKEKQAKKEKKMKEKENPILSVN